MERTKRGRRAVVAAVAALGMAAAACAEARTEELGRVEFQASGAAEARPWFERGVAALHSFWYEEAEESFRRAREIDPRFVLAYWGEAMTHNHPIWDQVDVAAGRAVLEALAPTAEERAAKAPTERERAYLEAVEVLYPAAGDGGRDEEKEARDQAYEESMARLAERFPDDAEARIFHALAIEGVVYGGIDDELRFPMLMRAAASLEELFDRHPEHPGVLHYLIHAYDDPTHAPLGLRAALLYARVAPAAHHALHMPSHIFVQLGRWDEASASNEDAWQASVDWVEQGDLDPARRDFHSLSWLLYAYLQEGRYEKARETLEVVRAAHRESPGGRVRHARHDMEARYRVETGRAAPPAVADEDHESEHGGEPEPEHGGGHGDEHGGPAAALAAGLAAYQAGDVAALRLAVEAIAAEEPRPGSSGEVQERDLSALLALAEGRRDEGLELLAQAAALEEALDPPSGPPETIKPAHELYGDVLLALERPEEAAEQYEVSLRRTPRRALSLLGAARAAAARGDRETAEERYRTLLEVWDRADDGLPAVGEAREYLAAAGSSAD